MARIPNNQDLEKLFKTSFDDFEPEVNVDVWNKIQQNIPKGAIQSVAVTSTLSKLAGKLLIGTGAVATVITTLIYLNTTNSGTSTANKAGKVTAPALKKEQTVALTDNNTSSNSITTTIVTKKTTKKPFILPNKFGNKVLQHPPLKTEPQSATAYKSEVVGNNNDNTATSVVKSEAQQNKGKIINPPAIASNTNKYDYSSQSTTAENNSVVSNNAKPVIGTTSHSGVFPLTITFSNNGGNRLNKWDFGDGTYSTEKSPVHTYEKVGIYKVVLTSEDGLKDVQIIQVLSNIKVIAPNFFSPDGDGINDEFKVTSNDAQSLQVQILDMSGKEVGHIDSQEGTWNGKNIRNGEPCKPGNYLYIVSGVTIDGRQFEHRGSITLKR